MNEQELAKTGRDGYYHAPTDEWYVNGTGPLSAPQPVAVEPPKASAATKLPAPTESKTDAGGSKPADEPIRRGK